MIQLIKASQLSPKLFKRLQALVSTCHKRDGYLTKFYWYSSENRPNEEFSEFVYVLDGKPVGYLALYQFSEDEIEVCAVVHPDFRKQGIFNRLWMESTLEMMQRGAKRAMFIAHSQAGSAESCLKTLGARYYRSELRMVRHDLVPEDAASLVKLRSATEKDVHLLAKIDQEAFGGDYRMMYERLHAVMGDPDRQIFIAEVGEDAIGKVHVLYESEALVHDLCIRPQYQGKGFSKAVLAKTINQVLSIGYASVAIEVSSDEYKTVKLYRSLGFESVCTYKYWMSQLEKEYQPSYSVLH